MLIGRLKKATKVVEGKLNTALSSLAQKVRRSFITPTTNPRLISISQCEVKLSILWEEIPEDPADVSARRATIEMISQVITRASAWQAADRMRLDEA